MKRCVLCLVVWAATASAAPVVLWTADPVRPGEAALVFGEGFQATESIQVVRLADGKAGVPTDAPSVDARGQAVEAKPLQACRTSVKFVIPPSLDPGVFACRIRTGEGEVVAVLNRPSLTWLHGDAGPEATPGGTVRAFGRCLAIAEGTAQLLLKAKGRAWPLAATAASDEWSASAALPPDLAPGTYQLHLHNGCGGAAGWSNPLPLVVRTARPWPSMVFSVRDFGAKGDGRTDDTLAIQAALAKAKASGGGIVYFPRGRYKATDTIELPPRTTLRGQQRELTAIFWPDTDEPPEFLVFGKRSFAVEDLTFYCTNYVHFLGNDIAEPEAGDVHVRRVRFRGVIYRGHPKPDQVNERFKAVLKRSTGGGDTLRLRGSNITVSECDLYGSGRSLFLLRGRGARIHDNKLYNGRWGWYCISGADGVVFERNELTGGDLMSTGGGINCLYGVAWSQNVHYARNHLARMHGWDREAMTSDAGGGAYAGPLASATATSVTLADDPEWRNRDWKGAAVFVLDGKGMGQYRRLAAWDARRIDVDEPWTIVPDATSVVSVTMLQRHYSFIGNSFEDAGVAIQLYGMAMGNIMAGNTSTRTGGFHNFGMRYHGIQPNWFSQWLDNVIVEGNVYQGGHNQHKLAAEAHLGVFAFAPSPEWSHPMTLCTVVRRNRLLNNAHIAIGNADPPRPGYVHPVVQDVVVENNHVEHADVGIWLRRAASGVLLRGNTFRDVADEVLNDEVIALRLAAAHAKLQGQQDPIVHLTFDEVQGPLVPDASGHGFHGHTVGAVKLADGVKGKAAQFDGKCHVAVGNGQMLHVTTFTIAAWIKPATVEGRAGIAARRDRHAAAPFVLSVQDGRLDFEACAADHRTWSFNFRSPPAIKVGQWQHVAAVVREGIGVTLYLDGKPIAEKKSDAKLAQNDLDLWIGKEAWGAKPDDSQIPGYFQGTIDDVKVWSRALAVDELRNEATRRPPPIRGQAR
ncbi:hypothetical protein HQ576_17005 [bacterium]|nr:hypothetical protein [bacterium]